MAKILVAGAGHGGLVAAAQLAKNGFDVTLFEKGKKEDLGHDWEDRFTFSILENIVGKKIDDKAWRYRGDCAFVSPAHRTKVVIKYTDENRQKVMWRKPLIGMLVEYAENCGVKFEFETAVLSAIVENDKVVGLKTAKGEIRADLVIDAAGVFSPVRMSLPASFGIEKEPKNGDLFYAYRAYFDKNEGVAEEYPPFEVYLYHEGEKGLSWHCTNEHNVDILIGRVYPLTNEKVDEQLAIFRKNHPWTGNTILHGGNFGIIPVRRPLTLMVADGYAAVGDSAFMTTPMNGMGIDLSMLAGELLAKVAMVGDFSAKALWAYNRDFHRLYGGDTAKNEGLKNSLLTMPSVGVDFLFDNAVIQSSDLAGAGRNTKLSALLGKFVRGMKQPKYFFAILKGLIKGGKASKTYKKAPEKFDKNAIAKWNEKIEKCDITFDNI